MDKPEILEKLHFVPIILCIALPVTVISTYAIAVSLDHVEAGFPYISDTATYAPESCIFAQFVNMITTLMVFVVYIKYSQIKECTNTFRLNVTLKKWNRAALIFGLLSTLGLSLVANFQETSVIVVHFIGAFMCFGCGTLYFWTLAICSYYMYPLGCSLRVAHARLIMSIFSTIGFFLILICGILAHQAYNGENPRKWYKDDGGWELHVASTAAEWICATIFCIYVFSFTAEFRELQLPHPKVTHKLGQVRSSNEVLNESQDSATSPQTDRTIA